MYGVNSCLAQSEKLGNARYNLFDLIILDFSMPVMDGLKIAKIFKVACDTNSIKRPPVILLTAYERDYFDSKDL